MRFNQEGIPKNLNATNFMTGTGLEGVLGTSLKGLKVMLCQERDL